jgi:hypothetical protein
MKNPENAFSQTRRWQQVHLEMCGKTMDDEDSLLSGCFHFIYICWAWEASYLHIQTI